MNGQIFGVKIKFGVGVLTLGAALVSMPAFAQQASQRPLYDVVVHHHYHHPRHLLARVPQDPARQPQPQEPKPCIHAQTSCM
jgi:hypothetical protein